jgi:GNAT superfamily N-acetyltransferase
MFESLADGRATDISSMMVHPEYQGRGIGSRLLSKICVLADKTGQDVYLEATPAGTKLYLNAGFQPVGDISFLDGEYVIICMLKKAGLTT